MTKRDILYVDDEAENLIVFEAGFEDDFNVWTANSGPEALELVDRVAFPVVVADQRMPGMSGAELFEIMRQRCPLTRRIILTGHSEPSAILDAINKGQVYYFMTKPWERDVMMSLLIRAIEAYDLSVSNLALTDRLVVSERCATLGRVAARVAHEMGNQICMLPLIEAIEDRYNDHADLVQLAAFARQTHDRLVALIQEIKSFVHFDHDGFARVPTDLGSTLQELLPFLRFDNSIPIGKLHLELRGRAVVMGNKMKLQQVIVNFVKNAAYAIRDQSDGYIRIALAVEPGFGVISVSDNGCGMSEETQAHLGDPFFTTKGREGSGLGVDISRRIIEAHGGRLSWKSRLGEGTTFSVRLPLCDETVGGNEGSDYNGSEPASAAEALRAKEIVAAL